MKHLPDIEVAKKMINLQQSATSRNIEFDLSFEISASHLSIVLSGLTDCADAFLSVDLPGNTLVVTELKSLWHWSQARLWSLPL